MRRYPTFKSNFYSTRPNQVVPQPAGTSQEASAVTPNSYISQIPLQRPEVHFVLTEAYPKEYHLRISFLDY